MTFARFQTLEPRLSTLMSRIKARAGTPIDLTAVGQERRIHTLEFRSMLLDGALEPTKDGFKVYIYDRKQEFVIPLASAPRLTRRQRFTLAHEIAHTFFFDVESSTPRALKDVPPYPQLEPLCDRIASEILLPELLLKQSLGCRPVLTSESVLEISEDYEVSVEAVLRRIAQSPQLVTSNRLILFLEARGAHDATILAQFYGTSMLPLLPRPEQRELSSWNSVFAALRPEVRPSHWTEMTPGVSVRLIASPNARKRYFLEAAPSRDL